ncbi:unnamed protein product, partial [Nippostrongylus brasiliensis]|uniref:Serpentine receptor class gamma n=1 Tax=Nippostrongylus brasiliensis TaxID=27835 RepID=A0A0N4XNG3_NIPBR
GQGWFHYFKSPKGLVRVSAVTSCLTTALVIQSFMPVFFSFPTKILYLLAQFTSFHSMIAEYLMFAMSPIVAVVDPCITLYYILPYRKFVTKVRILTTIPIPIEIRCNRALK